MANSFSFVQRNQQPEASADQKAHKIALRLLSLTIFLLMADPLLNVYIGRIPVYAIDFLAIVTWVSSRRINSTRRYPLQGFVMFIIIAMLVSELIAGIQLGTLFQPIYLIGRTLLAISLFFSTVKIIQQKSDLLTTLKAGLMGALITAVLMVASSLPQTQGIVARQVFVHSFLLPSADNVSAYYGSAGIALRGQSLVGVSILSAAFLNAIWPLLFLLRTEEELGARWRFFLLLAIFLIPLGIVLSYSRGAIAGLVMIVLTVVLLSSGRIRGPIIVGVGMMILVISWVGWGSQYFLFDWLQNKTQYQLVTANTNEGVISRTGAYTDPFQVIQENPIFIFWGEGLARQKIVGASSIQNMYSSHAVFGAAAFSYGLLAALAYMGLLLGAFRITWKHAWGIKSEFLTIFSRALLAGLFGFSSWFVLGPAAVTEPRGAMLLFFVFGLVAAQSNFAGSSASEEYDRLSILSTNPAKHSTSASGPG